MIKAVLFDVGGVLTGCTSNKAFRRLARVLKVDYDILISIYRTNYNNSKIDYPKFSKEVIKLVGKDFDVKKVWKECYMRSLVLNEGVSKIADSLRKNYIVGLLTNASTFHSKWRKEADIYKSFKPVIVSSDYGIIKPDEELFKIALDELKLKANEIVFIDDIEKNIDAANKLGFKGVLFKNTTELRKDLKKLGLKFT